MQRLEIVALACELIVRPNETPEDGKTTRTIEELMDEVIRRGIVPDISWSSVQRILAGLEVKPHKTEQWFHSPDPEFRPKVTAICDLYLKPPPAGSVVLCIDEKPGMQALARRFPDRAPAPGRRRRREFEYKRQIAAHYPNQVVHVIWDGLNIHYDGKDERWKKFNERHGGRFVFRYTPKHAW